MSSDKRARAIVNSRNRLNPITESSHNFTFSFNRSQTRIYEIEIERVEIPYTFYAITTANNVLTFNSGADSITITPGNYTATTLTSEMVSKLNTTFAGQTPAVAFSSATYKLTISKTSAFIVDAAVDVPASTASYTLGFHETSASGTSVTADSVMNISGPSYVLISSTFLANLIQYKTMFSSSAYQTVFWAVPVNCSPGDIILENPATAIHPHMKTNINSTDVIDFQLYDDQYAPLDLNGADWAIQFIFHIE